MPKKPTDPIFDALRKSQGRKAVVTSLDTAGLRKMSAQIRANAVFTARGTSAAYATKIKEVIDLLTGDEIGEADAIATLFETITALGYTPEGGFPAAPPGKVPPVLAGTLQDLSSMRRLRLLVRTQQDLMGGAGQQWRGHTPSRLEAAPAWELVRVKPVEVAREWPDRWIIAGGKPVGPGFDANAHQTVYKRTGMIALKGDPVWGELGSSENFSDALDVDHSPFCFGSGVGLREVSALECRARKITGPNGESVEEWQKSQPAVINGNLPLPTPKLSINDIDPDLVKVLKEETGAIDDPEHPGRVMLPPGATPKLTPEQRAKRSLERRAAEIAAQKAAKEVGDAATWSRLKAEAQARKEGK